MKKIVPPKNDKKNSKGSDLLPETITTAVAQAVLEDAVMEAAADVAALSVTLESAVPVGIVEDEGLALVGVPFLGQTRARALAGAGIRTMADLEAATVEQIGGVKGVGFKNAERVKEWLTSQAVVPPPPPPPSLDGQVLAVGSLDPKLASANQTIFDDLGAIDQAVARVALNLGPKKQSKKLGREFDKLTSVTSELAEGPDTLGPKSLQQAVALLQKITDRLSEAAEAKALSDKKQERLAGKIREQRKALEKVIG